jgi:hypothetical protein
MERSDGEFKHIITIFLISACTLLLMLGILFPVVRSVNSARLKILSLFIDIPYSIAITLAQKCQRFIIANVEQKQTGDADKTEVNSEDMDEEGDEAGEEEEEDSGASKSKSKNRARIPIFESAMKDNTFFMQFGVAMLLMMGYFVAMLVVSLEFTSRINFITEELNLVA